LNYKISVIMVVKSVGVKHIRRKRKRFRWGKSPPRYSPPAVFLERRERERDLGGGSLPLATPATVFLERRERERDLGGGSLPLASAAYGVFRYPLCGALPRNAPKIVISV
jgi:hypothetical protein